MKKRFTDAAKIHAGDRIHLLEAVEDALKSFISHTSHGLIPRIAEAGDAIEVTSHRRFDVNLREVSDWTVHADKVMSFVEADFRARNQPVLLSNFGRKNEASIFVHFCPGGCRFL